MEGNIMKSLRKKTALLLIAAAVALSCAPASALAEDAAAPETAVTETAAKVFTIEDAIAYAKEHSSSLAAARSNVEYTRSSAREAGITRSKLRDNRMLSITDVNTVLVTSGYAYQAALAGSRMAQRALIQAEYTLESSVSTAFYKYLSSVEKVKIAEASLESALERTAAAQVRHEYGFISDNAFESFQISEQQARNALSAAQRARETNMLSLKSTINYPLDADLNVVGSFTRQAKEATTYAEALEKAKNSITRANAEENLKTAAEKKRVYQAYYTSNQPAWHSAEAEYATAEVTYNNAVNNERINLFSAWSGVQSAYEGLDLLDKTLALKEKTVEANRISFNMGTVSAETYLDSVKELDDTRNSLLDTELSAYMANEQYRLLFDCSNTIFEEDNK